MAAPMKNICGTNFFISFCHFLQSYKKADYFVAGLTQRLCRIFTKQCSLKSNTVLGNNISGPLTNNYCTASGQIWNRSCLLKSNTPAIQCVRTRMDWPEPTIVCDKKTGKPQPNQNVLKRFYRLNSGLWIRTRAGRGKKLWTKYSQRRYRLRQHVICNAQQSTLLDKMVTDYWKKKTYFVDDPYEPYQKRTDAEKFGVDVKKPKFVP